MRRDEEVTVTLEEVGAEGTLTLTRATLNACAEPLLTRTLGICAQALKDAGIKAEEIAGVVLVGGMTRMPYVRTRVAEFFGRMPLTEADPDEVVALGAALQAHNLTRGGDHLLLDVTPLSLGLEVMGGLTEKIIPRNTPIPVTYKQVFTTYEDGQNGMQLHVVQGERETVEENRSLARFELQGIPPMAAGLARVEVTFQVDADGLLSVRAQEMSSGAVQQIEVLPSYGLPFEEVERMLRDSMEHAEDDMQQRLLKDAQVEARRLLRDLGAALEESGDLLAASERDGIDAQMVQLAQAVEGEDREVMVRETERLNALSQPFAQRRMDKAIASALQGQSVNEAV